MRIIQPVITACLAAVLAIVRTPLHSAQAAERPNVLVIMADDK